MVSSVVELAKVINNNSVRSAVNQLSAVHLHLIDKVDADLLNQLGDLIQTISNAQRDIAVTLSKISE